MWWVGGLVLLLVGGVCRLCVCCVGGGDGGHGGMAAVACVFLRWQRRYSYVVEGLTLWMCYDMKWTAAFYVELSMKLLYHLDLIFRGVRGKP